MRIAISTKELYQQVLGDGVRFTEWPSVFFELPDAIFVGKLNFGWLMRFLVACGGAK